ncbi:unnamed protein product [Clonostachys rosea f. rosea IK726]|uniref:N-acetyltransferase domain-containing protein n=2 Tax=Bionectria ochroleuca TaxID=29856 RepID=A0A0B7JHY8_BIOOC|nr:unnamed protein product [Clonostachys rosea f. rosea IK726]
MPRELILANPTPDESRQTWTCTHPLWGAALSLDGYILRETRQADLPLARDGGLRPWVLVEADSKPDSRDILSSCETLRKRALVRRPDGEVNEVIAHGVASVFTDPAFRGKGHASTMMACLGEALQAEGALLSVLWSDIGKEFYNKHGWRPFESDHLEFPPRVRSLAEGSAKLGARFVSRESDSVTSLRWFGDGDVDNVEWLANEKFAWC